MTERIDHAAEARKLIAWGEEWMGEEGSTDSTNLAVALHSVTHATLALVEAQQEANEIARASARIALAQFRVGVDDLPHLRHLAVQPVGEYNISPVPEVAAALGIETKETDDGEE